MTSPKHGSTSTTPTPSVAATTPAVCRQRRNGDATIRRTSKAASAAHSRRVRVVCWEFPIAINQHPSPPSSRRPPSSSDVSPGSDARQRRMRTRERRVRRTGGNRTHSEREIARAEPGCEERRAKAVAPRGDARADRERRGGGVRRARRPTAAGAAVRRGASGRRTRGRAGSAWGVRCASRHAVASAARHGRVARARARTCEAGRAQSAMGVSYGRAARSAHVAAGSRSSRTWGRGARSHVRGVTGEGDRGEISRTRRLPP